MKISVDGFPAQTILRRDVSFSRLEIKIDPIVKTAKPRSEYKFFTGKLKEDDKGSIIDVLA